MNPLSVAVQGPQAEHRRAAQTKEQPAKVAAWLADGRYRRQRHTARIRSTVRVLGQVLADEDLGNDTTGERLDIRSEAQLSDLLEKIARPSTASSATPVAS